MASGGSPDDLNFYPQFPDQSDPGRREQHPTQQEEDNEIKNKKKSTCSTEKPSHHPHPPPPGLSDANPDGKDHDLQAQEVSSQSSHESALSQERMCAANLSDQQQQQQQQQHFHAPKRILFRDLPDTTSRTAASSSTQLDKHHHHRRKELAVHHHHEPHQDHQDDCDDAMNQRDIRSLRKAQEVHSLASLADRPDEEVGMNERMRLLALTVNSLGTALLSAGEGKSRKKSASSSAHPSSGNSNNNKSSSLLINNNPLLLPSTAAAAVTSFASSQDHRISELQVLLSEERDRGEQRKSHYESLKGEHLKLQKDFLDLQSEMKQVLHETRHQMERKDAQMQERESLIQELRARLADQNPVTLRASLLREVSEPINCLERQKEALERENQRLSCEIRMHESRTQHLEKEAASASDRLRLSHEAELNLVQKEKQDLRMQLLELSQSPDASKYLLLQDENHKLTRKVNSLKSMMQEMEVKYSRIQESIESLLSEYEASNQEHEMQINSMRMVHQQDQDQKEVLQSSIRDHKRLIQELTDDLKRSEEAMQRSKQASASDVAQERESKHHLKAQLDHQLEVARSEAKQLNDENGKLSQQVVSLEKELSISKAAIKTFELSQVDHEKLKRSFAHQQEEVMALKSQLMETTSLLKEVSRQKDHYRHQQESLKDLLTQERKQLSDFKTMSERNLCRLRTCIQEERSGYEERISRLEKESKDAMKQREEYKAKYRSSASILDQLRIKMTAVEKTICASSSSPEKRKEKKNQPHHQSTTAATDTDHNQHHSCHHHHPPHEHLLHHHQRQTQQPQAKRNTDNETRHFVSPECHERLRRQYKELKTKQSELTELLNCMQHSTS